MLILDIIFKEMPKCIFYIIQTIINNHIYLTFSTVYAYFNIISQSLIIVLKYFTSCLLSSGFQLYHYSLICEMDIEFYIFVVSN